MGGKKLVTETKEGPKGEGNPGACDITGTKEGSVCEGGTQQDGMLRRGHLR